MFSDRSALGDEPDAWTRAVDRKRAEGVALVDLTPVSPAGMIFDDDAVRAALGATPEGEPSADRSCFTANTSAAYAHAFALLADPGDEILVPTPGDPRLAHLAQLAGVALVPYACRYDGRWSLDAAELFEAISERTRAIAAGSPSFPTGAYLDADALDALASLDVPLIVDESHHAYALDSADAPPRASDRADGLVLSIGGAPQLGLGWITVAGDARASEALVRLQAIAGSPPDRRMQHALSVLHAGHEPSQATRAGAAENLAALRAASVGTPLFVPRVEGGACAPVRLPSTRSDEAWALALLDAGVLAAPGSLHDFPADEVWLVLSLLAPPEAFARAVTQLERLVR